MKTYYGERREGGNYVCLVESNHPGIHQLPGRQLDPRLDLRNHSPSGFEWGYGGSGPAQLALALLADALDDDEAAQDYYQQFKWAVVSGLADKWTLTESDIKRAVARLQAGENVI